MNTFQEVDPLFATNTQLNWPVCLQHVGIRDHTPLVRHLSDLYLRLSRRHDTYMIASTTTSIVPHTSAFLQSCPCLLFRHILMIEGAQQRKAKVQSKRSGTEFLFIRSS